MVAEAIASPDEVETPLLEVDGLTTWLNLRSGRVRAIEDLSFSLSRGESLAIVGESGCGKSVTALSIMRLLPAPPAQIEARALRFESRELLSLPEAGMRAVRGRDMAMIFQEPMSSLHPLLRTSKQLTETMTAHTAMSKGEIAARAIELLKLVRIPDPELRLREYPHNLSGGMRQRVMIAMALACNPKLLIADEPTTALDVTIQAQILDLIRELRAQFGMAILLITHDMGVVAENADRVIVMYAGRITEQAPVADLFAQPLHPYTAGLMASIPRIDPNAEDHGRRRLNEIPGLVPSLQERPAHCAFAPRCPLAIDRCRQVQPPLEEKRRGHYAACWRSDEMMRGAA
ncbi:ABC transporter ATP-binding protein [Terrirubrum flagellatum]|uniref:ABC transporter ATP-binding protein n=1 Tax=Terrirubrum flagellatum TaxID=2895980 RepID=UPI003CC83165